MGVGLHLRRAGSHAAHSGKQESHREKADDDHEQRGGHCSIITGRYVAGRLQRAGISVRCRGRFVGVECEGIGNALRPGRVVIDDRYSLHMLFVAAGVKRGIDLVITFAHTRDTTTSRGMSERGQVLLPPPIGHRYGPRHVQTDIVDGWPPVYSRRPEPGRGELLAELAASRVGGAQLQPEEQLERSRRPELHASRPRGWLQHPEQDEHPIGLEDGPDSMQQLGGLVRPQIEHHRQAEHGVVRSAEVSGVEVARSVRRLNPSRPPT